MREQIAACLVVALMLMAFTAGLYDHIATAQIALLWAILVVVTNK
jgi:Na+/H+ antiporter NhaD/arsenite permease-like protein